MTQKSIPRADLLCAFVVAVLALTLYLATLQPDLGGPEDTPKFQFLGYVLGTAHPPGYPLYVLLSHVFVQLPIGTIAYRANLFSAVMAALACALTYVLCRQLGAGRVAAVTASTALATGVSFWTSAVFAEVYSLAAVMVVLTLVLLLAWGERGGVGWLLGAAAAFAAGLGNHLTIVGLVPAAAIYVLVRDRRVLTPRVLVSIAVILALGVAQYGFIILRTRQHAPFLESAAFTIPELVDVITAKRFATQRFAFGPMALLTIQLPGVASAIRTDMGIAGVVLLAIGLATAIRRRSSSAGLIVGAALGLIAMVLNLSGDTAGFVTPIVPLAWVIAGVGVETIVQALANVRVVGYALGTAIAMAVAAIVPAVGVAKNYATADQSEQTADAQFFRGLFPQLPDRAAIVADGYLLESVVDYLLLTGDAGPRRGIVRAGFGENAVRGAVADHRRVYAFGGGATYLATAGLVFDRAALTGPPLDLWLRGLPRRSIVAAAVANAPMPTELFPVLRALGRVPSQSRPFAAFAFTRRGGTLNWRDGGDGASLDVRDSVVAKADRAGARIEVSGQSAAAIASGLAVSAFEADGTLMQAFSVAPNAPARAPLGGMIYEFAGEAPCVRLSADQWTDVSPVLATGSWVTTFSTLGSVAIESEFLGSDDLHAQSRELMNAGTARIEATSQGHDGVQQVVTTLTRTHTRRPVFRFALDRIPSSARARVKPGGAVQTLTLCGHVPPRLFADAPEEVAIAPDFDLEAYFGAGWSGAERSASGRVRRGSNRATVFLPLDRAYTYHVDLDVTRDPPAPLDVRVNGAALATCGQDAAVCRVEIASGPNASGTSALTLSARAADGSTALTLRGVRLRRMAATSGR